MLQPSAATFFWNSPNLFSSSSMAALRTSFGVKLPVVSMDKTCSSGLFVDVRAETVAEFHLA